MPELKHVAVVTQSYFSGGGVQTVARWVVRGLRAAGLTVHVHELGGHHPGEEGSPAACAVEPGVTHWAPRLSSRDPVRYLPVRGLAAALDDADVVQVVAGGPALVHVTRGTRRPVVLQVATRIPWERAGLRTGSLRERALWVQGLLVGAVEPAAVRAADAVLVENRTMAHEARRLGARHVVTAPPGVDTDRFTPGTPRPDGYLLSVCRLWDPRKALWRMVDGYAAHRAATGDPRPLVLAGRGELHAAARERIDALGLHDEVHVRNDVPLDELVDLYRGASQFWQTSTEEGLGLSMIEAMACGLPVVGTASAGARECLDDGAAGVLVPLPLDDDAVVAAWPAAVSTADARSADLRERSRERAVAEFSDDATLQRYLTTYRRLHEQEKPMRVLVVTVAHPPQDARIWFRETGALRAAGHDITYVAPFGAFGVTNDEVTTRDVPRSHGSPLTRLTALAAAARVVWREAPRHDLVIGHDPELIPLLLALRLRSLVRPMPVLVWDDHEDVPSQLEQVDLPPLVRAVGYPVLHGIELLAERTLRLLLAEHAYQDRFTRTHPVVPNSTSVPQQTPPPAEPTPRVVYLGSLTWTRGARELVDVARAVPEIRVEIIGNAKDDVHEFLTAAAAELDNLDYLGFVPNPVALQRLDGALAGLSLVQDLPNYRQSQLTKLLEYMAHGVPFVTTPGYAQADLAETTGAGIVTPYGDTAAVADALRRLDRDRTEQARMASAGYAAARRDHDWALDGPRFVGVLEGWVRENQARRVPAGLVLGGGVALGAAVLLGARRRVTG